MTPIRRQNLQRLLKPRHVAVIGGRDAETAIHVCKRIGFEGPIWPVNPKRDTLGDIRCFSSVDELPQAPDAVFLAVPAKPAIDIVARLAQQGAGGVVCYTAGFSADGKQGGKADQPLVDAVGDMALVGPNCYGLINYIDRVALWPFAQGGFCPGFGAAVITQSGMLSSDITMNQRSVPLAYMVSAGNQSVLQLEDYIDVLCERDEVNAIGLHIEGLKDIESFSRVARKALERNKPIVVLKTGTSKIGSRLTISHTGSLSCTNELYQALFERLGIISVTNPAQMLETLKFICVAGIPRGNRMMGFTCSGGSATMLADYAEKIDLEFPQPSSHVAADLVEKLPVIADVSNPLDYTPPIWGIPEKVQPVFEAALADFYDTALIVQDFPLPGLDESKPFYLNDLQSFIQATSKARLPGAVCSTLPENIDKQTREFLIANKVTPLQGIHEALDAINAAAWYGRQQAFVLDNISSELVMADRCDEVYPNDEWNSKVELKAAGLKIPEGRLVDGMNAAGAAQELGFPVALKMNSPRIAHKTEIGAVCLGLKNVREVHKAVRTMRTDVARTNPELVTDTFLVERMVHKPLAELMVDIRTDSQFGLVMTLSSGGALIELIADAVTLILPASDVEILLALEKLKISRLLNGFRGSAAVNKHKLTETIKRLANYVKANTNRIAENEINQLIVIADDVYVVDVLMQLRRHAVDKVISA